MSLESSHVVSIIGFQTYHSGMSMASKTVIHHLAQRLPARVNWLL